jgi:hypothetical protein
VPSTTASRSRRSALLLLVAGTAIAAIVAASLPTYSLDTIHTGRRDNRGFPLFYTDDSGMSLRICENGTRRCLRARPRDLRPPNGEAVYWQATATLRSQRGPIEVIFALEAAFAGRGRPVVFDRIRVRGHLRQAGRYVLEHPYGSTPFRAINPIEQRNVDVTHDSRCSLKRKGRCNGRITNFLRAAREQPPGYIGPGTRRTRVTGGTLRNNLVLRTAGGEVIGSTDKFAVVGRKAGRLRRF